MTDTPAADAAPAAAPASPEPMLSAPPRSTPRVTPDGGSSGPWRLVLSLIALLLLGAAAYGGWMLWQERTRLGSEVTRQSQALAQLQERLAAMETQQGEMGTRQGDLSRQLDRTGTEVSAMQSRIQDSLGLMGRISEELSGGRTRFQLIAVEHLLLLASDRLLLERDPAGALAALEIVDQRLAALSDPRLYPVREAVAAERAALQAVPRPDLTSATLGLSSLIERVPQLPLFAHAPSRFEAPETRAAEAAADGGAASGWRRVLASVQATLQTLFTVRRDDNARSHQLLPPDAEAVIVQVLILKLEGARVALLRRDTVALREELRSADAWLDRHFKPDDPGVLAARSEIARLQGLDLAPALPETGRSLAALRSLLVTAPAPSSVPAAATSPAPPAERSANP